MRNALSAAFIFFAVILPAHAEWTLHGHIKYQALLQEYSPKDIQALIAGERLYLNSGDFRLNASYHHSRWDFAAQGEAALLQGSLIKSANEPIFQNGESFLSFIPAFSDSHQWFNLNHTFVRGDSYLVQGRLDRLSFGYTGNHLVLRFGRQALSWGDGLVFQVLDFFNPFPPNAIDTEYKPGSDMITGQWLFANGDDLQAIIVPRRADRESPLAASQSSFALKWHHLTSGTELQLLAARHYENTIAGLGITHNLAGGILRFDLTENFLNDSGNVVSFLINMDRSWVWFGRNIYGFGEYFRNGFGANSLNAGAAALPSELLLRLQRGELFNVGRHELAAGFRVEWTPLTNVESTGFINPNDGSSYVLFHFHHDWRENALLDAGVQLSLGPHNSEFGGIAFDNFDAFLSPGNTFWSRISWYF